MTYRGFLAELTAECDDRARRRSQSEVDQGRTLPRGKFLRTFAFDARANIDPATVNTVWSSAARLW
ncbi:hypothetical protein [Streptomyces sp. NPDC093594]|uniref:hypothetical protein n=1 Tax=Streptomyces sp. NPDC093594 TaxID=3155305 RepID=UPI00344CD1D0